MHKKILIFFITCLFLAEFSHAQSITVSGVTRLGRFASCGSLTPNITVTYVSGTGSSVVNGALVCSDPCDSTILDIGLNNLEWSKFPNNNWIHGVYFPANAGLTFISTTLAPANWNYTPLGCTGTCPAPPAGGVVGSKGYYYTGPGQACCPGGGSTSNPCDNYGDQAFDCNVPLNFGFRIKICNSAITGSTYILRVRADSDGNTGCWNAIDNTTNTVTFLMSTVPCGALYNPNPTSTTPTKTCSPAVNYTATLTGGCGNSNTITWWTASTGGTQVGSGSPFVYDPPGTACPAGTTLYAACCPSGTTCVNRKAFLIPGSCAAAITITNVYTTNPSCATPTGSIDSVKVTGNSGAVTYTLNPGGASNTTGVFPGLTGTNYTLTATDASGCVASANVVFTGGGGAANFTATATSTATSCPGVNNGSITVTSNPAGSYTYVLDGNTAGSNTTGTFTGVSAGMHIITVTSASCSITVNVTVASGAALAGTSSATNTSCNNATNGTMTATPTAGSGTSPFSYTINATPSNTTGSTSGMFTGLAAGTYTITFTDANGCQGTTTQTIAAGPALTATASTTAASCPGVNNGSVTITSPSGTSPFSYTINATPVNTTGASTGMFTGLGGGNYIISFTDANGCSGSVNATVATGAALAGTSSATNTSCNNATNGTMTATPTAGSGTSPYSYTINATPANTTGSSSGTFTGLAAGTYTITFTDANGCQGTTTQAIAAGSALTATASTTAASCPGVNNGSVTITSPTGTSPFSYIINATPANTTGASTGMFTGLTGGNYIVSFTDANGCTGTVNATVAAGAALAGTSTFTNTSCNNATNGTMAATPTAGSGTSPYSYTINATPSNTTGASSGAFTGLAAGTYTITFTDANGCQGTTTQTITAGPALTATASTAAASCPGVNNGSVTITSPTGTSPFSYTINATPANTTGAGTGTFTGLSGGNYIVSFTDANGCSGTVNVTVATGAALSGTSTSNNTSCNNATNGTMAATPTAGSGTSPYSYTINATPANTTGAASGTFTGLAAGVYTITFTDANGCTGTTTQTIAAGPALTATASTSDASCPGINNGSVTISSPTGTGPFSYTINATPANTTGASTGMFTGLSGGNYMVSFTDANGCTGTVNATVATGAAITGTSSSTNPSCNNATNGTMTATPNAGSGTSPFSYTINTTPANTTGASSGAFTGLAAGTYTITFTDANGCQGTTTKTITAGPALTATASTTAASCPGVNNGSLTITSPTGTSPFSYTINATPANTTGAASGTFTGLAGGNYIVSFTDASGCTGTVNATVATGAALTATSTVVSPNCAGINDGSFGITPTNGSPSFSYTINATPSNTTGASTGTFSGLAPGMYTITYTDANGCTGNNTATLTAPAPLTTPEMHTNPTCNGSTDGSIIFTASGGTAPYLFALLPAGIFQSSNTFTGLSAGSHSIRIKDAFGCTKDTTILLTEPSLLTAQAIKTRNTGCSGNDGGISVTASGGTAPYQYSINNGSTYQTGGIFNNATNTTYNGTIKVKDANGCIATANNVTVGQDATLTLDIIQSADTTLCEGEVIKFTPMTNAGASANYQWTSLTSRVPNSTINRRDIKDATVRPADTAFYKLTVTSNLCTASDSVKVNVLWKPKIEAGLNVPICLNDSALLKAVPFHNSGPITKYVWTPSTGLSTPESDQTWATPLRTTLYTVTASTTIADYGCAFTFTDSLKVILQPRVRAFAGNDTIAVKSVPFTLHGSGGRNYTWSSPTATINNPFVQNAVATLNHDANFYLKVEDAVGCAGFDSVFVKVYDGPTYWVPNAFSPNGDGLNDIFRVIPVGISNTTYLRIFNRYDELVFETNQYLKGWDGNFKGKPQPNGVFVWMVKGSDKNSRIVEMKGNVMIVR